MIIDKEKKTFKGYVIFLNNNAIPLRQEIRDWCDANIQFCIIQHQLINICFFSDEECLSFVLAFFDCLQNSPMKEIEYKPATIGMLTKLEKNYKRKKRKKKIPNAFTGI